MPIYEYKCKSCEHTFEVMQKLSDPPLTACTHCSGEVTKIISPSGLVFKGSGWYITDYSDKGKDKGTDKGKTVKSKSGEGETKKSPEPSKTSEATQASEPSKTPKNTGNGMSA